MDQNSEKMTAPSELQKFKHEGSQPALSPLDKVRRELAKYEHVLFDFSAHEKGDGVEVVIDFRNKDLGVHTYYFQMHPRDLQHPQFEWTFQRQLYDCVHDYIIEMFTRTPQSR